MAIITIMRFVVRGGGGGEGNTNVFKLAAVVVVVLPRAVPHPTLVLSGPGAEGWRQV